MDGARTMMRNLSSWALRNMPTREQMARSRLLAPFAHRVLAGELWRFNRRSVPRGVALGMLVGIAVPFAQIVLAALFSLPARANVPVAALTTFVTNPFTTPFIWAFAYKVGDWLLRVDTALVTSPVDRLLHVANVWEFLQWLTAEGKVLALGLAILAVSAALVSWAVSGLAWSAWVRTKRRRRLAHRGEAA